MDRRLEIRTLLDRTRKSTERLLRPPSDTELAEEITGQRPPLARQLAEIAYAEELWLLRQVKGDSGIADGHDEVYEALENGHAAGDAPASDTPSPEAVRDYARDVRKRAFRFLERVDLDAPHPLLRDEYVFGLVVQNELQGQETMLETLQARTFAEYRVSKDAPADPAPGGPDEIHVPAATFLLGAVDEPWAYDNELAPHEVEVAAFWIDRAPVTNEQFAAFVADRGYTRQRHWSEEGWEWREREDVVSPLYWEETDDGWVRTRFGRKEPLALREPVQHVSWYEADAFARWAGKRLPSEVEWERAAGWHDHDGKFRYPWGQEWMGYEANLGRRRFSPAPSGSYGGGVSPIRCVQMAGDVWEWTSSSFSAYPGFLAFPYPGHSEIFFGDAYRVLRGGSWATDGLVARTSFRRWSEPGDRLVFAGFRCARDDD